MKLHALFLSSVCFLVVPTSLASPQKLPHIEGFDDQVKVNATLVLKAEAKHHFNQESPLSCGEGASIVRSDTTLNCTYKKAGEYKPFLAVCDDGKKYCKIFRPTISVGKAGALKSAPVKFSERKTEIHHGFKVGDPETILSNNFKQAKPKVVLLDFFALWCPPCNDLDELVFPNPAFQKLTKDLEKIKINVDEPESWTLKEKYNIQGYPTLLYLNAKNEEVGRSYGTQSPEVLVSWIEKMKSLENMPLRWALTQSDDANVKRIVEWNFDTNNFQQVKTLTGSRNEEWAKQYFLRAQANLASDKKDKKAQQSFLSELMTKFPNSIQYGYWVLSLSELDKKAAIKNLPQALLNIENWMKNSELALKEGLSYQDLLLLKTDLLEALEQKEALQKAQSEAITYFESTLAKGAKISRGRSHILAYFYRETGRLVEAKKIYEDIVKANPKEATFYFRYAKVLRGLKEYPLALEWLEKGAPYMTEGNSRLQYASLKGQLLNDTGKKQEALQIVNGTLAIAQAPNWEKDSANRWIKELTELKQSLEQNKP